MTINSIPYGDDDTTQVNYDGYDTLILETGGTVDSSTGIGDQDKNTSILDIDEYKFRITTNVEGASVYVNGIEQSLTTPTILKIKKSKLFKEGSTKTIEVRKEGYSSNEEYQIFVTSLTNKSLDDVVLSEDETGFVNLKDIDIKVRYLVNGRLQKFNGFSSSQTKLKFNLIKGVQVGDGEQAITTILTGDNESAVLERITDGQVFPIRSQEQRRTDNQGTRYLLKTADISSYRIGAIRLIVDGKTETIYAEDGESISTEIVLNADTQIEVATQRLVIKEKIQPRIFIRNKRPRLYNKNEPTDIPIRIMKNSAVKAISVVIGDEIIEFDELPSKDHCVITLPSSAFKKLGSYNVKFFPYSIEDIESFTNEQEFQGEILVNELETPQIQAPQIS